MSNPTVTIAGIPVRVVDNFKTKEGRLTHYALACGYVERQELNNIRVDLWHEGGPTLHVRCHDFNQHKRLSWECFETLTTAREHFDLIVASLKGC